MIKDLLLFLYVSNGHFCSKLECVLFCGVFKARLKKNNRISRVERPDNIWFLVRFHFSPSFGRKAFLLQTRSYFTKMEPIFIV